MSVIFKIFIFPNKTKMKIKTNNFFFYF